MKSLLPSALLGLLLVGCAGPRSEVEVYHVRDLVLQGQTNELEELVKALGSSDEAVRTAAIRALASLDEKAIPTLKKTIAEESKRSSPAMLALGQTGEPDVVAFIRQYRSHSLLGSAAIEAEAEVERQLLEAARKGDFEAMEDYLETFPESKHGEEVKAIRRERLAAQAFEKVQQSQSTAELETFLKEYADSDDAPAVRAMLARLLVKDAQTRLEAGEYAAARTTASRIAEFDPRREQEAKRLIASAYLAEGKALKSEGKETEALPLLTKAAEFQEFRLEATRLQADILLAQGKASLEAGKTAEAIRLLNQVADLDPVRRPELDALKANLAAEYNSKLDSPDPAIRRQGLLGLFSLNEGAIKPLEVYLGKLFAKKDYAGVEEVVSVLSEARRAVPPGQSTQSLDAISGLLANYLKASLVSSNAEVSRLFGAPDFIKWWKVDVDPFDPQQYPLIFRVEGTMSRHLGLSRVALSARVLLNDKSIPVPEGVLLNDTDVLAKLLKGEIGQDTGLPLLVRTQLCARYSGILADLNREVKDKPELFMQYAVGLSVPPLQPSDWAMVAEGFKRALANSSERGRIDLTTARGGLRTYDATLIMHEYDKRNLTLMIYDPVVDTLGSKSPAAQAEASRRVLAILMNTTRIAFGLYPGLDRYTVIMGTTAKSETSDPRVRGGQVDPEVRMVVSQKTLPKINWTQIRNLNGAYTSGELDLIDVKWYRWQN